MNLFIFFQERVSRAKLLQFVSGVRVSSYWITSFLFNFLTYLSTAFLVLASMYAFQEQGWSTVQEVFPAFVAMIFFGFSMLPITYVMSRLFSIPSSGLVRLATFYIFTGVAVWSVLLAMSVPKFGLTDKVNALKQSALIFPHFSLCHSLNNLNRINKMKYACHVRCKELPVCNPEQLQSEHIECIREYYWQLLFQYLFSLQNYPSSLCAFESQGILRVD